MPELRPYQITAKQNIYKAFNAGTRSVALQLPTGGGKSVILASITSDAVGKGRKVLMLVHRKELVDQLKLHMHRQGIYAGIIMAGNSTSPSAAVQVASVQTLTRRLDKIKTEFDLLITDECHHAVSASYQSIYARWDKAKHLGVTATLCRTNGQGFRDVFDELVVGASIKELIAEGFLVRPKVFASPLRFDLSKIRVVAGDYNESDLYAEMDKATITASVVDSWKKHADGMKTCVFCINIEHSKKIADAYNAQGIPAIHISANTPKEERARALADFASGRIKVLTNCDIISEGFDLPSIECVQLVRPTKSLAKYLQCVGRGLRPLPGKDCAVILDHADSVFHLGFPDDDRAWTLDGLKPQPKTKDILLMDKEGKTYSPSELPEEITDVELIEVDATDFRRKQLDTFLAAAREVEPPAYQWAWRQFIKAVKLPTKDEIYYYSKEAGTKRGWPWVQMVLFRHIEKPPGFDEKYGKNKPLTTNP